MTEGPKLSLTCPYPGWSMGRAPVNSIRIDDRLRPYDPASPLPVVSFVDREAGTVQRYNYDTSKPIFTQGKITIYP